MRMREDRASVGRIMVADETYERLKAQIMDQVIAPGARISIDGLARELGVSQTPIRESLARLESEGLAVKIPLRGYRATPLLTSEEFEDLYQFRRLIEPWAARRAAERVDAAGVTLLREEMRSVAAPTDSNWRAYRALTDHDERFHGLIAALSGSEQLRRALERTHCHLHTFRLRWDPSFGPETLAEHSRVADAVAEGRAGEAEEAMVRHLDAGLRGRLGGVYEARHA
jgi:DNA-binding GntR family transcriptional regulator